MPASDACVIIGAGPAGLTTAYELARLGRRAVLLEADTQVGGLSRTCEYKGYRFDIGGHRFFTQVGYVQQLWDEILGDEFLVRPRLSRIHYRRHLFDYPLKPWNAIRGLGPLEALRVTCSYARALLFPSREERSFEQWVSNRFGRRCFEIFFKTYTEKVWGLPCSEISAEWATQRIKNLDLGTALRHALLGGGRRKGRVVSSLIDEFHYPRHGPGQMWTRCAELLRARGTQVRLDARVISLEHAAGRVRGALVQAADGRRELVEGPQFVSSMAIRTLLRVLDPPPPAEVLAAAERLRYRDFITVALIVRGAELFPDNWIYIHSEDVAVGRVQNYKNWSPDMVPDPSRTALGFEYFVSEHDALWSTPDEQLVELARRECDQLGLARADAVEDGVVLRVRKAYPVYDRDYKQALACIRGWLSGLSNLQLVGRNGQHRYNNQDHSMMTGVLAARNVAGEDHDIWSVNVESRYHEQGRRSGDPLVPLPLDAEPFAPGPGGDEPPAP